MDHNMATDIQNCETPVPARGRRTRTSIALGGAGGRALLLRFGRDESGSYLIITGLLIPVLVGFLGLGTEIGLWLYRHQTLQGAADSAAVSAGTAYYTQGNSNNLSTQAEGVTASYGFVNGQTGASVTVNKPPQSGTHTLTPGSVEVIVRQVQNRLFSVIWNSEPFTITARAVAVANGGTGCVLALNPTASGSITVQGNAQIVLNGCSLYDDSNNG